MTLQAAVGKLERDTAARAAALEAGLAEEATARLAAQQAHQGRLGTLDATVAELSSSATAWRATSEERQDATTTELRDGLAAEARARASADQDAEEKLQQAMAGATAEATAAVETQGQGLTGLIEGLHNGLAQALEECERDSATMVSQLTTRLTSLEQLSLRTITELRECAVTAERELRQGVEAQLAEVEGRAQSALNAARLTDRVLERAATENSLSSLRSELSVVEERTAMQLDEMALLVRGDVQLTYNR